MHGYRGLITTSRRIDRSRVCSATWRHRSTMMLAMDYAGAGNGAIIAVCIFDDNASCKQVYSDRD